MLVNSASDEIESDRCCCYLGRGPFDCPPQGAALFRDGSNRRVLRNEKTRVFRHLNFDAIVEQPPRARLLRIVRRRDGQSQPRTLRTGRAPTPRPFGPNFGRLRAARRRRIGTVVARLGR